MILVLFLLSNISYGEVSPWAENEVNHLKTRDILKEEFFDNYQESITRKEFAYLSVKLYEEMTGISTEIGKNPFKDTNDPYILRGYNAGLFNGYGNDKFHPDDYITREEIASLFIRILTRGNRYLNKTTTDVVINDHNEISDWAKENVLLVKKNNIMNGIGNNLMGPHENTTKEQAMLMAERVLYNYKDLEDILVDGFVNFKEKIDISAFNVTTEEISQIINKMVDNNPKLFTYDGFSYYYNGDKMIKSITFKYIDDQSAIVSMRKELDQKVDQIIDQLIENGMNDFTKEKVLHDYIVKNTIYDENYSDANVIKHTAYGALVNNKAVCDGYSKAMDLLLKEVDIPSRIVTGTADGVPHSWNLVELDREYYYLDITYNDPLPDRGDEVMYSYFNVTNEKLRKDHDWNEADYPIADSLRYNYYVYYDLYIEDEEQFNQLIQEAIENGEHTLYLSVDDVNKYDLSEMIRKLEYRFSYSYSIDYNMNTYYVKLLPSN